MSSGWIDHQVAEAMAQFQLVLLLYLVFVRWGDGAVGDVYYIGTGRYDITGPAAETEMVLNTMCHVEVAEEGGG